MSSNTWRTTHNDEVEVYATGVLCLRPECTVSHREYRYRVRAAGNGEIVESGEGYKRRADAITAALRHHPEVTDE